MDNCEVIICRVDSDGCVAEPVVTNILFGTHEQCCEYMRTHRVRRRRGDRNKYEFAIRYAASGRLASYVL